MSKENSQNVKKIIEKLKEYFNLKTDGELATLLGVTNSTISTWKNRNSINYDIIFRKAQNIDMNWLLYDQEVEKSHDYSKVNHSNSELEDEKIEYVPQEVADRFFELEMYDVPAYASETGLVGFEHLPKSIKKMHLGMEFDPKHTKIARISGDSMEGSGIRSGDYILYTTNDKNYNNREIIARLNGVLIVKTLKREDDKIVLYSNYKDRSNPVYVGMDDNLEIAGVVLAVVSYR